MRKPEPGEAPRDSLPREVVLHLDSILEAGATRPFNGNVLLTRHGETLYARSRGFSDRGARTSLRADSQFLIGSLSKQMTAALVLREAEAHRLQLDAPIGRYLPELADDWKQIVTTRQLLNHTSGIEALGKPLVSEPGKSFSYTNLDYDLLGRIVERTSGEQFGILARTMFDACRMARSEAPPSGTVALWQRTRPLLTTGYDETAEGVLDPAGDARDAASTPSGGILSTAGDLHLWSRCLHGGLLSPASYQSMTSPSPFAVRKHRWGDLGYAFGLQVSTQGGLVELSHSGYVPGYIATLITYPEEGIDVVVLENTSWQTADMARVFHPHDRVRAEIRSWLMQRRRRPSPSVSPRG